MRLLRLPTRYQMGRVALWTVIGFVSARGNLLSTAFVFCSMLGIAFLGAGLLGRGEES